MNLKVVLALVFSSAGVLFCILFLIKKLSKVMQFPKFDYLKAAVLFTLLGGLFISLSYSDRQQEVLRKMPEDLLSNIEMECKPFDYNEDGLVSCAVTGDASDGGLVVFPLKCPVGPVGSGNYKCSGGKR